jgi:cytochrome c oxidase cbb3-type subunit 3/ubiquinol-cytochrome c reductase cytochrome c subunit
VILAVLSSVLGCGRGKPPPPDADSRQFLGASLDATVRPPAPGRAVTPPLAPPPQAHLDYLPLCGPCHGPEGRGYAADHAPSLVNPTFLESASNDFLRRSIASGRPGTSMGAYGKMYGGPLDDAAIDRLVAFLRRLGPPARPLKTLAVGDPGRGEPIYRRVCQPCHGDARTRGEAVHLANSQFLRQASDAFINHAIVNGRPGTKMLAFSAPSGTLTGAQIADVVAFVRAFEKSQVGIDLLPPPTGHEPLVLNPRGRDPVFTVREGRFVAVAEVERALAAHRRLIVIDARPPSDWMRVHVKGAVSIPYHDLARLEEVPDDVWAVAYCACPHHLSGEVVDALVKRGHSRALVLDEGINEWHRRGFPVVAARGVTPPVQEPAPALPSPLPAPAAAK